jgi:methionyl aminopeptidase
MGISIKSKAEVEILREGGKRLASILARIVQAAKAGVSTAELDGLAERLILAEGGIPIFKGYKIGEARRPYPSAICVSINDEVVHGIPRPERILREGDAVGIDIGMSWPADGNQGPLAPGRTGGQAGIRNHRMGLVTDMAVTIGIGKISPDADRLIHATREALDMGIAGVKPGARIGDIGYAIGGHLKKAGLGVIRDLAGHGVGYELHEEPLIPNYGKPGTGLEIREGMVLALEPMATLGSWEVVLDDDEWTFRTADGALAAHFEHTVAVTKYGAAVVTQ